MTLHVFVGPTLSTDTVLTMAPEAQVHPPVAHGDLLRLECGPGDIVLIIDGYYHQVAPVRHKEILQLLSTGVRVVGCSSLGALRASELERYGMVGHGQVFRMYRDGEIDSDAEVAVAHLPGGDFRALNVTLVNIRIAAASATRDGTLTENEATEIVSTAQALHYTQRSWLALEQAHSFSPERAKSWSRFVEYLECKPLVADTKRLDAIETLEHIETVSESSDSASEHLQDESWQNELIYSWLTRFSGKQKNGTWVSEADVLCYHQLYSVDFPQLWESFVLASLGAARDGLADAIRAARTHDLSKSQVRGYLTTAEAAELDTGTMSWDEAVAHTVVRTFSPMRGYTELKSFAPELLDDEAAQTAVARALWMNDDVRSKAGVRLVDRLSESVLRRQLCRLWQVSTRDRHGLLIAALDRGFPSAEEAISSMRLFYLFDDRRTEGHAAERWVRT